MRENVRKVLDIVEDLLLKENDDSQELWNILTALRGPDTDEYNLKLTTTVPIRRAAFPRIAKNADFYDSNSFPNGAAFYDTGRFIDYLASDDKYNSRISHFYHHASSAAASLGIR